MSILSDYGKILPQFFTEEPKIMRLAIGVGSTAVQIDDSCVGLSFTLSDTPVTPHWAGIAPSFPQAGKAYGSGAYGLLSQVNSDKLFLRCIGLATINALSQSIIKRGLYQTEPVGEVTDLLGIQKGENVVLMGAVKPMLQGLVEQAGKLYVVERGNPASFKTPGVTFGTDLTPIESADVLLIASRATLLLEQQLKPVLARAKKAREIVVMGPNYCMIPDVLFQQGVTRIAARKLTNNEEAVQITMEGGRRNGFNHISEYYSIVRK
ncbi:MAG: Rossmann-like domain-containing protein [Candidatus Ranarchaeia archaeon]|jgi:uncharacterized protein (DUF4213/DUF364 family)